jgi:putative ABC transport system permease protein
MIAVTLADLVFRARQFVIALVGVALVMAMALLLTGLANGFKAEVQWTVGGVGATHWTLAESAHGSVTSFAAFPEADATAVAGQPGVTRAAPLLIVGGQSTRVGGTPLNYNLAGVVPHHLGDPSVAAGNGHGLAAMNQAVVDVAANLRLGSQVALGGREFTVVGTVNQRTLLGGSPLIYVELPAAQAIALGGRPLITSVVSTGADPGAGAAGSLPAGLEEYTSYQVVSSTVLQMRSVVSSITNSTLLMWIVAAIIVAALLYVAALERRRDFAVLKALGSSSAKLFGSLVLEAVVVTLVAGAVAEVLSNFLRFVFKQPVVIPTSAYLELPVIAVAVGMVASLVALRNATGADPAAAFS